MARFSIIVPVTGIDGLFDDTLASALRHRPGNSEIIVVHDGTYQDPYGLTDEITLVSTEGRAGLIEHFNAGVANSNGDYVAFLRPGVSIDESWEAPVEDAFSDSRVASVSPAIVTPSRATRLITAGIHHDFAFHRQLVGSGARLNSSRRVQLLAPLGPTSWAAFYRGKVLRQLVPMDQTIDSHFLDLEIGLTIQQLGYKCHFAPECVVFHDFARIIERENEIPHGLSSQRAIRRHVRDANFGTTMFAFLKEIAVSPFASWQFKHAIQRMSSTRYREHDRDFANRIVEVKRDLRIEQEAESQPVRCAA